MSIAQSFFFDLPKSLSFKYISDNLNVKLNSSIKCKFYRLIDCKLYLLASYFLCALNVALLCKLYCALKYGYDICKLNIILIKLFIKDLERAVYTLSPPPVQ